MIVVVPAVPADAGEVLTVQLAGFVTESRALGAADIPPLRDTVVDVARAVADRQVLVARDVAASFPGRIVGTVRLEDISARDSGAGAAPGHSAPGSATSAPADAAVDSTIDAGGPVTGPAAPARVPAVGYVGRLAVAPDRRGEGIAARLLAAVLIGATGRFDRVELVTARRSAHNVAMYARRGWVELPTGPGTARSAVDDIGIEIVWMSREFPPSSRRIRELRVPADAGLLTDLWTAAVLARSQAHGLGPGSDLAVLGGLGMSLTSRADVFGVVVQDGGFPVAAATAVPARTADGAGPDLVPGLAHLSAVCVDPVAWGRGAGAAAVTAVLAAAAARGLDRAQLVVDVDNDRARALYQRLGFVQEPGWSARGRSGSTLQRWSRSTGRG